MDYAALTIGFRTNRQFFTRFPQKIHELNVLQVDDRLGYLKYLWYQVSATPLRG